MRILLLNPPSRHTRNIPRDLIWGCWCKGKRIASAQFPPTTLLYIYSVLKREGLDAILLDAQAEGMDRKSMMSSVEKLGAGLVIIPVATMTFNEDADLLESIKSATGAMTLAFGSHVTYFPAKSLEKPGLDFIVQKEPEYVIRDLALALKRGKDHSGIRGIGFRSPRGVVVNPPRDLISDLDDMPIPIRDPILKYSYYNPLVRKVPWTTAITSRGCPAGCNFCTAPTFHGRTWRHRSPKSIVEEMEYLASLGYKEIFYRDETFTFSRKRAIDMCRLIVKKGIRMSWICSTRADCVDDDVLRWMARAGCHMIRIGVESGSQRILDNIKKGITLEQTKMAFSLARKHGIETHAHVMIGCIGETDETVEETIRFVKEIAPTTATFGAFTPYPGTPVFNLVSGRPDVSDGTEIDAARIHDKGYHSHEFCSLDDEKIGRYIKKAYKEFYMRPRYVLSTLSRIRSYDSLMRTASAAADVVAYSMG